MARRKEAEPPENHERWLLPYADMITLMLAFFIIMYALSLEDKGRYNEFARSVRIALGLPELVAPAGSQYPVPGPEKSKNKAFKFSTGPAQTEDKGAKGKTEGSESGATGNVRAKESAYEGKEKGKSAQGDVGRTKAEAAGGEPGKKAPQDSTSHASPMPAPAPDQKMTPAPGEPPGPISDLVAQKPAGKSDAVLTGSPSPVREQKSGAPSETLIPKVGAPSKNPMARQGAPTESDGKEIGAVSPRISREKGGKGDQSFKEEGGSQAKPIAGARASEGDNVAGSTPEKEKEGSTSSTGTEPGARDVSDLMARVEDMLKQEIARGEAVISVSKEGLKISLRKEILFELGSAELSNEARSILERTGELLRSIPKTIPIEVQGHTDSFPVRSFLYPSNWELSAARATAVVRFFSEEDGIDGRRLTAAGFAHFQPVQDNDTPEHRRENRRIDIVISDIQKMEDLPAVLRDKGRQNR